LISVAIPHASALSLQERLYFVESRVPKALVRPVVLRVHCVVPSSSVLEYSSWRPVGACVKLES